MQEDWYKAKLYKVYLAEAEPDCFGNHVSSDNWDAILKAMDDDLNQRDEFNFVHPKNSNKQYYRHYKDSPANGNTLLIVGQFRYEEDFAYVRIILNSYLYKHPYIVLERYNGMFHNPDHLAKMVERAFNWIVKSSGVKVILEPWDTKGQVIQWSWDYTLSYDYELRRIKGANLPKFGFENTLHDYNSKEDKKKKRREAKEDYKLNAYNILHFMSSKVKDKEGLLAWLDEKVKGQYQPIGMMRPVRFLINMKLLKGLTFAAFNKRYHKEGLISVSSFNNYTNTQYSCFTNDPLYDDLEESFDVSLYI